MSQTLEAVIDEIGQVRLLRGGGLPAPRRELATILEEPSFIPNEPALLSEAALSDWNRPEE